MFNKSVRIQSSSFFHTLPRTPSVMVFKLHMQVAAAALSISFCQRSIVANPVCTEVQLAYLKNAASGPGICYCYLSTLFTDLENGELSRPDEPFPNFKATKSADWRIQCSSGMSCDGFEVPKLWKGSSGGQADRIQSCHHYFHSSQLLNTRARKVLM